ncbi:hypothetical protein [Streptomyces sp. ME18-1-4]|uniref:hypothetical protein n=1 Tax=Streptomyces sp. ME18-1-4 TaxID=3028685 RepID=UPI0029BB2FF8|nr:hypothetical protein [Streptomyces sp. ME18-1-4]MDX3245868.1 hypothetical protein [Streptomyces sp. ME18-1-4]
MPSGVRKAAASSLDSPTGLLPDDPAAAQNLRDPVACALSYESYSVDTASD